MFNRKINTVLRKNNKTAVILVISFIRLRIAEAFAGGFVVPTNGKKYELLSSIVYSVYLQGEEDLFTQCRTVPFLRLQRCPSRNRRECLFGKRPHSREEIMSESIHYSVRHRRESWIKGSPSSFRETTFCIIDILMYTHYRYTHASSSQLPFIINCNVISIFSRNVFYVNIHVS